MHFRRHSIPYFQSRQHWAEIEFWLKFCRCIYIETYIYNNIHLKKITLFWLFRNECSFHVTPVRTATKISEVSTKTPEDCRRSPEVFRKWWKFTRGRGRKKRDLAVLRDYKLHSPYCSSRWFERHLKISPVWLSGQNMSTLPVTNFTMIGCLRQYVNSSPLKQKTIPSRKVSEETKQEWKLFFSRASELAAILNPPIWLANHTHVTGPAFYDTAHGPDFFPAAWISLLKVSGNRQAFALFTHPLTISQRKFICSL